ncbi:molybdenum cofactor biosynthesis protein MoaE [Nereida ignava]|uniref:Molybdopterin synthase catalytic subunit n=1 Tax=Nereida ignava TaxID=282199 RepID=A0A0U1NLL0_9RHOB|nr:molybdenum cofactor biosynthesis protein MoaE [Nereida ignava]CRK75383.1 Molybdopterin synthase catalytic subunit [Nereida ignava]SFJ54489.1 molybdopterin synthase subunit MoaE [Nereida ignava DSM 16309]
MDIRVQQERFDAGAELNGFDPNGAGAVVTFTGLVRDVAGGLEEMLIEHYPAMTEKALREIAAEAEARWQLSNVLVIHRFGSLQPDEPIMMVATASRHRDAAFEAATFLMDYLKSRAPFWKKETTATGENWVESTVKDEEALKRW